MSNIIPEGAQEVGVHECVHTHLSVYVFLTLCHLVRLGVACFGMFPHKKWRNEALKSDILFVLRTSSVFEQPGRRSQSHKVH